MAKPNKEVLRTEVVEARYPHLNKADDRYGDPVYKITAVYPSEKAAAKIIKMLQDKQAEAIELAVEDAKEKAKKAGKKFLEDKFRTNLKLAALPIKKEEDEDGEETGRVFIGPMKMKAAGTTKDNKSWERVCPVFNGAGKPIDLETTSVWGGSQVVIAFTAEGFYTAALGAGCSLRLEAVQVRELRSGKAKSAEGFGFETDGEGLEDETEETSSESADTSEEDCPF